MATDYRQHNCDRLRRAKSWCEAGLNESIPDDEAFLFLWIAFNAAYGRLWIGDTKETREHDLYMDFIGEIIRKDTDKKIRSYLVSQFSVVDRVLRNKYIYEPFWDYKRGNGTDDWKVRLDRSNRFVVAQWRKGNASKMLEEILRRLSRLRNQIIHGGTTYKDSWGESQLRVARLLMRNLVPMIIEIMEADINATPDTSTWGKVAYMRFEEEKQS